MDSLEQTIENISGGTTAFLIYQRKVIQMFVRVIFALFTVNTSKRKEGKNQQISVMKNTNKGS